MDQTTWLDAAKVRFGFAGWPRRLGAAALPRVRKFALALEPENAGWVFERRVAHGSRGYADYLEEAGRPTHRVMVRVAELDDHDEALLALLELLSESMAVSLPRLDRGQAEIGDVAFRGHDDLVSSLFFVRHNILIDVRSIGDEPVSVLPFAGVVDAQIQNTAASRQPHPQEQTMHTMLSMTRNALGATMYNDLYVRDTFGDTGVYPSAGNPSQSPDIIPLQSGVMTWATANATYVGPDQGLGIINGGVNNIYVRAKNLNTAAGAGWATLYYANASLFLLPSTWTQLNSPGGAGSLSLVDGSGNTNIAAGGVAISSPAFLLTGLPSGPHYCLITVLQTATHPVTIPATFPSNAAFAVWVQNNPAVGWRNISYQSNQSTQLIRTFGFASINPVAAYFHFRVLGRGFATGTTVTAQCTDQSCPINASMTLPAPDGNGNQIAGFDVSVPANFSGSLVLTATSPAGAFPTGATLTMTYYQYPSLENELEMSAAGAFTIARDTDAGPLFVVATLVQIGECTVAVTDNPTEGDR